MSDIFPKWTNKLPSRILIGLGLLAGVGTIAVTYYFTPTDFHAHLGQCLLRQGKAQEAAPLLERVVRENPKHDYGHTLMAYAETLGKLGQKDAALAAWRSVLEHHSYARARVQLAQLYRERGETELARKELTDFLADETHGAAFQRQRDKPWVKRAKALLKELK